MIIDLFGLTVGLIEEHLKRYVVENNCTQAINCTWARRDDNTLKKDDVHYFPLG